MATLDDVRAIALGLPEVIEQSEGHGGGCAWRTKRGLIVWERGPRTSDVKQLAEIGRSWPEGAVAAIHIQGAEFKDALLGGNPDVFFTIPHFQGYPALLFRLDAIDQDLLEELIVEAWLARVPKRVAKAWLAEHRPAE